MFRGVCASLGRATGTDPVLWRVLVVVLTFFGGSGLVLYLAGWLLIPEEGRPSSELQRLVRGQGASAGAVVALAVLLVLASFVVLDDGRGLVPLLVIGVLAYLVLRGRQSPTAATAGGPDASSTGWATPPAWTGESWTPPAGTPPGGWGAPPAAWPPPPPPPPAPPAPTSPLGLLTISAAVVVAGAMLLAGALGVDGITATRVLSVALLVVGGGLLLGAVWGRARWLIAPAVVLALAVGATSAADGVDGSTGERRWVATGSTAHRLGAGSAVLDLRPLAGTERRDLTVESRVGLGELVVLVPEDLRVDLASHVGLGELSIVQTDGTRTTLDGPGLQRDVELGPDGARNVRLDVRVGLGELEVRRVAAR